MLIPSKSQPWAAGKTLTYTPWVPRLSKSGRRNVVHGFIIEAAVQLDTTAAGVLAGEDQAKFFRSLLLDDIAGPRRILTGEEARIMAYLMLGPTRVPELADVAVSQTDLVKKLYAYLPFEVPRARGRYDCVMPADTFRALRVVGGDQDSLDIGGAATTIDSADIVVYADVREDDRPEDGVSFFARDLIQSTQMETLTQGIIDLSGALLAEAAVYKTGADGGASMANWTSHQLVGLEDEALTQAARLIDYRMQAQAANNPATGTQGAEVRLDPVTAGRAALLHYPRDDYRMADLPRIDRAMRVIATNTVTSPVIVHRTIEAMSPELVAKVARGYGVRSMYAKTTGKTKRNIRAWGDLADYVPKKGRSA